MAAADTAWMLIATALVLLMTPALAFFYGGLVRSKNALNTIMMSVSALGFAAIGWVLIGYSVAFAPGSGASGGLSYALLRGVGLETRGSIPHLLFVVYQATFAIVTVALISGAVVERMRFTAYLLFVPLWTVLVYAPVAHWVGREGHSHQDRRAGRSGRHPGPGRPVNSCSDCSGAGVPAGDQVLSQ